ncbi:HV364 protein, partial [Alcedo cyanopectus]|nr:HV364 protein [Ceyx cyanopectus]
SGQGSPAPRGSLSLLCKASGFSFSKKGMFWVQQERGKWLQFVASINSNGGKNYAPSVKGRCSISRDNAQSTVTLHLISLRDQDSATYYC